MTENPLGFWKIDFSIILSDSEPNLPCLWDKRGTKTEIYVKMCKCSHVDHQICDVSQKHMNTYKTTDVRVIVEAKVDF